MTELAGCLQKVLQLKKSLCELRQKKGNAGQQIKAHRPVKKAPVAATAEVQVLPLLHCMLCTGTSRK